MEKKELVKIVGRVRPAEREAQEVRRLLQALFETAPRSLHPRIRVLAAKCRDVHDTLKFVRQAAVKAIPRYNRNSTESNVDAAANSDEEFANECLRYKERLEKDALDQQESVAAEADQAEETQFLLQPFADDSKEQTPDPMVTDDDEETREAKEIGETEEIDETEEIGEAKQNKETVLENSWDDEKMFSETGSGAENISDD